MLELIFIVVVLIGVIMLLSAYINSKRPAQLRTGKVATKREIKRLLSRKNKGFTVFGDDRRLSHKNSYIHKIIYAPSGSMKTQTSVLPDLLGVQGNTIAIDIKGELMNLCAPYQQHIQGKEVLTINLANVFESQRYNPLALLHTSSDIKGFCTYIYDLSNSGAKTEGIWKEGAISLLSLVISTLKSYPDNSYHTLANVIHLLDNLKNHDLLDPFFKEYAPDSAFQIYINFKGEEDKIREGKLSGALAVVQMFNTDEMKYLSADHTLSFADFRRKPLSLYIHVPMSKQQDYAPIITLFFKQLVDYLLEDECDNPTPLFLLLEEFGNLKKISGYASFISLCRSKKIGVSHILQNIEQLDKVYSKEGSNTILNNCFTHVLLPGSKSQRTLQYFGFLTGETTHKESKPSGDQTRVRPLFSTDEMRRLKTGTALAVAGNHQVMHQKTTPLFRNRNLMADAHLMSKTAVDGSKYLASTLPPIHSQARGRKTVPILDLAFIAEKLILESEFNSTQDDKEHNSAFV